MTTNKQVKSPIIYALDFPTEAKAKQAIDRTSSEVDFYKIGLELFLASGWEVVEHVHKVCGRRGQVMLDLKFLDIPNTVAAAVKQARKHSVVKLLTVHGQRATVKAAVEAKGKSNLKILAVTLLTSTEEKDLREFAIKSKNPPKPYEVVLARAEQSLKAGADGLVASAQEAELLKNKFKNKDFTLVTPGIRPANSKKDDQRRTATPKEAVEKGADYFVIGRPISTAKEPLKVIRQIKEELAMAIPPRKKTKAATASTRSSAASSTRSPAPASTRSSAAAVPLAASGR